MLWNAGRRKAEEARRLAAHYGDLSLRLAHTYPGPIHDADYEEMSIREIAAATGASENTIAKRLSRAWQELRSRWKEHDGRRVREEAQGRNGCRPADGRAEGDVR